MSVAQLHPVPRQHPVTDDPERRGPSQRNSRSWRLALTSSGIARVDDLPPAVVASWNRALDPLFARQASMPRAYVDAGQLAEVGVLSQCLTPEIRALISATAPGPVLYHCHAYEIAAGSSTPHIRAGRLDGWHRDEETVAGNDRGRPRYSSLFVYLSDVDDDAGPFELVARPPRWGLHPDDPVVRATGPAGTAFAWNRTYFHRASPNRGRHRRRLLKLSWQPAELANDRLGLTEFTRARRALGDTDGFLAALLGAPTHHPGVPTSDNPPPPRRMDAVARVGLPRSATFATHVMALRHLVTR